MIAQTSTTPPTTPPSFLSFRDYVKSIFDAAKGALVSPEKQAQRAPTQQPAQSQSASQPKPPMTPPPQTGYKVHSLNFKMNIPLGCILSDKELDDLLGRTRHRFNR